MGNIGYCFAAVTGLRRDSAAFCCHRKPAFRLHGSGYRIKHNVEAMEMQPGRIELERAIKPPTDEARPLTLLTFNIRSANDKNGSIKLEEIVEEIRETDAHIIGLQEVERMMPRSGYRDQARLVAEELGYHYYYGGNINIFGVQYGNALLSKYPILAANNHKLPREKLEPRGMIEADIDADGSLLHVFVTHLGLSSLERSKQVRYINGILSQRKGNILLLGDFNNHPDSEEMSTLDDRLTDSAAALNQLDQFTFALKSTTPNVRLDRIYASDNITLKHHRVQPSAVSDHSWS